ncbi:MAG TPA: ABC transporter permease [Streptosporangiaceae bacterium]|nr:ABC transporter permease [Streptosporangiaceae bacterium]
MSHFFTAAVLTATVAAGIQLATPFLLAALGETMGQRSGVVNLGVDGIMLLGAFVAYYVAVKTGSLLLATAAGLGTGLVMGLVTAFVSVTLKAEQGISGIGVFLFGLGITNVLLLKLFPSPVTIPALPAVRIPLLYRIPYLGHMFFTQNWLVYLAFLLVPVFTFVLNRTTYGMKIRAVGENPAAADTVGVSVTRIRYSTVILGCAMAGLAGATLVMLVGIFQEDLTNSEGFIAVALVYFGAFRPIGVMAGSLLYGMVGAVVVTWKTLGIIPTSASDIASMAPAVLTVLALLLVARRFQQPAALGKPYLRGG